MTDDSEDLLEVAHKNRTGFVDDEFILMANELMPNELSNIVYEYLIFPSITPTEARECLNKYIDSKTNKYKNDWSAQTKAIRESAQYWAAVVFSMACSVPEKLFMKFNDDFEKFIQMNTQENYIKCLFDIIEKYGQQYRYFNKISQDLGEPILTTASHYMSNSKSMREYVLFEPSNENKIRIVIGLQAFSPVYIPDKLDHNEIYNDLFLEKLQISELDQALITKTFKSVKYLDIKNMYIGNNYVFTIYK